jgi:hypothetical protein
LVRAVQSVATMRTRILIILALAAITLLAALSIALVDDGPPTEPDDVAARTAPRRAAIEPPRSTATAPPALPTSDDAAATADPTTAVAADPRESLSRALETDVPITAEDTIARIDRGLAASGASEEPWTGDAGAAFVALEAEMRRSLADPRFSVSDLRCFAAGCVVTVAYPPGTDVQGLAQTMVRSAPIIAWPGGKLASPTIAAGDGLANRWVLLRPDAL